MATHARMAADPKNPDAAPEEGDGPLKNGTTSLEDSDDSSGGTMAKGRSPAGPSTQADGFQDGGPPNSRPADGGGGHYPASAMDRAPHYTGYEDGPPFRQQDYDGYRGGYDQHGGDIKYPQYNQIRPRGQPRYPGSRFVSGPSLSQQTGPTPTLNQLLQAPNSMQRYHNNYEYPKGEQPHHYPAAGPNNSWGGRGYPQQTLYRNQGDVKQRPYPGQMSSPGAQQPYPQQQQQYHPYNSPGGPRHNYPQQQGAGQQYLSGTPQHGPPSSTGYETQRPASYGPSQPPTQPPSSQLGPAQQQAAAPSQPSDGCEEGAEQARSSPTPHRPPSGSPSPSSMSPAAGQPSSIPVPPRPSSTQSENNSGPTQQGYNQQMAPPGIYGNKMHQNLMGSTHMSPYSPSSHYPQGGYHRPPGSMSIPNYGGGQSQQNSYPGSYPSTRMPPSSYPPASVPYSGQPPYPGSSGQPSGTSSYGGMNSMMPPPNQYPKSAMPPPPAAGAQAAAQAAVIAAAASSGSGPRQSPMYLRQHLQQKMYNSYGPEGPMPPPSTSSERPSASTTIGGMPPVATQSISSPSTVTTSSPSDMMQSPRNSMGPPPLMDEGSQASNASASSSLPEERVETPKPNSTHGSKQLMSHPPTPTTLPSPGAASMSSFHDDFESVSSPSWPRTPASPTVMNNQPYDHHPIKRPDGMLKLYDMSDDPERRLFLDKLILYQEERGTPLSQCPTISKQPLDLYRLYLAAKERGGFVEVMKGKMWKEIAGLVGIGASSGAAYTLRKQYIKHLLPFECKFDRGGIDPVPLISSLESNSRKKNQAKNTGGPIMDGYPGPYPGGGGGYPPGSHIDYPGHHPPYPDPSMHHPIPNHSEGAVVDPFSDDMQYSQPPQRHNSEGGYAYPPPAGPPFGSGTTPVPSTAFGYGSGSNDQQPPYNDSYPPNTAMGQNEPTGSYGGRGAPSDPYAPPPGGYPPNRTVGPASASQYPPYPCGDQERFPDATAAPSPIIRPSTPNSSSVITPQQPEPYTPAPQRYASQQREGPTQYQGARHPPPSQFPNSQPSAPYAQADSYNRGTEFQNYPPSQQSVGFGGSMPPPNKVAPPGSIPPGANMYQRGEMYQMAPKRHQDYSKDSYPHHYQQQTPPSQPLYPDRSQYQYRPSHGMAPQAPAPPPSPQQGWPRDSRSYSGQGGPYPQRDWAENSTQGVPWVRYGGPQSDVPYPHHMGPKMMSRGYGSNKMAPHSNGPPPQYAPSQGQRGREVHFPPDAVEATTPVVVKRRRLLARDVSPVDPWRLMMALKSGLLGEGTWALDVLGVLLHDDATVLYFGLAHLPGLLEVLMDHYRRCLNLVFGDLAGDTEVGFNALGREDERKKKWWELDSDTKKSDTPETTPKVTLKDIVQHGERTTLLDTTNYTLRTRCRKAVKSQEAEALFLFDPNRRWDVHEGHISGSSHWAHGGGEHTAHVQTHFEDDERRVRFCRVLQDKKECGSDTEEDELLQDGSSRLLSGKENYSIESLNSVSEDNKRTSEVQGETDNAKAAEEAGSDFPKIRPVTPTRKRRSVEDLEDESYTRDEPSLCTVTDAQDSLARRCIAASSILRNLSFVPGNDTEMSKHSGFLLVLGRLLLLHHTHAPRRPPQRHYDHRDEEGDSTASVAADSCSSLSGEKEWWWDTLHMIRENTLVTLANVCGQLDLAPFPEEISFPLLDGLMHWVTCPSSRARDPLPTQPPHSVLSPQRLSLEALSKLSVLESNVDLMMATPPWERTDRLFALLARWLARNEDQVLREFSVVLLSNLSQADSAVARAIALQPACVPMLLTFVEQAEQSALQVANAQGINALRENPELMGTTLDMVRRAAGTLRCLARVPSNRTLFLQHQQRLLALVMSQILDQGVASIIADVLFECSQATSSSTEDA